MNIRFIPLRATLVATAAVTLTIAWIVYFIFHGSYEFRNASTLNVSKIVVHDYELVLLENKFDKEKLYVHRHRHRNRHIE